MSSLPSQLDPFKFYVSETKKPNIKKEEWCKTKIVSFDENNQNKIFVPKLNYEPLKK